MKLKQFIFALVAMLSSFAFTANAAIENPVAKVGNTEYATIDEAIAAWTNGTTLTLLADVTLSDVIKLSSTEYHVLNLGTYTMTAGVKKNSILGYTYETKLDAIEIVNNGRSSASYALDINADATNPGGITASGKTVVKTTGKSGVQDRPIIRFYGGVFNGSNVVSHSGSNGTNCPQFWFYGGEFNGTISANRAKFLFYGGTFNGTLSISVDSSADALVCGGKFKKLSNSYGSSLNTDKFTIGSAAGVYDRGIYVDAEGYYVVTSEVITEVSAKYPAVKKESYNSNNYFYYSAAATYGMFYEVASMAGTGSNVTVWEGAKVAEELEKNDAFEYTPQLPTEVKTFEVEVADVVIENEVTTKVVFTVTPSNAEGNKVSSPASAITFRLPVPAAWAGKQVYVSHDGTRLEGTYTVQSGNYVEVTSASFSEFSVEPVPPVATIGGVEYSTLADAIAAVQDGETITLLADVTLAERVTIPADKILTIDLNGKSISMEESIIATAYAINNLGNLTITDGVGGGSINARGMYNGYGDGGANVTSATITVLGGTFNAKGTNGGAAIFNYGTANVNGGKFTSIGGYSLNNQAGAKMNITDGVEVTGGIYNNQDAELTVDGGNISNNRSGCHTIYAWNAKVTVNGGSIHNENSGNATIMSAGTSEVTINGGTISIKDGRVPGNGNTWTSCLTDAANTAQIIVNGGTLNGGVRVQAGATMTINGGSFNDVYGSNYNIYGTVTVTGGTFTDDTAKAFATEYVAEGYELGTNGTVAKKSIAAIGENKFESLEAAVAAAQSGDEIVMLADATLDAETTLPAGVTLNGNGKQINGNLVAGGNLTFVGHTKVTSFNAGYNKPVITIGEGACLEMNGTGRMVIGHGATFNITGSIADDAAKTTDKASLTPSLVMPGASFTGAGVTFNVTNAYIKAPSSYCSSSKTASGTFDFNITNSIWESAGKLAFEEQSVNAKVDFALVNSVLSTGSHLVFGTASGEEGVVIDNSNVNVGASRQLENCGKMTIKNGSVVNGAVATSSNAKNPGTVIVENATYAVTGEFSGSDLGIGTIIIKKGATVSAGSITKANIVIDATDMTAGELANFTANLSGLTGTLSVINNDKLEAKIENGKIVLVEKPVAMIGEQGYATLNEAFAAATEGQTITMLDDATPALTSQRAITKAAVIDLGGKTMTLTEDDLYFGTTTFKNGTIVVDPSVKPSTAVFWMFADQTLTFDNVKVVATGVTGTYLIGLDGNNSDLNLLNGSEILVENTTALDLDIICVNASTGNDIVVENSKVNVTNLDGRVFFRGNYTVKDSEVNLAGITKAGFRIEAGQKLSIEGTSVVNIVGEPRDGGIHMTDLSATYTKAETATVNATVNEPKVAKVGDNTYRTLAQAVAAVEDGGTITLIANETFTKNNRYNNGGWWDGLGYSGDKSFTIDLAGFTISQDGALNDYLMWFKNDGAKGNTITLKNGTLDAGTTAYCALATASSNAQKITVNLENIKVINNNSNGSTLKIRGGAELNVKAGTIITGQNSYLGIEAVGKTTVVNIYDGAEIYMNGTSSYNGCLVGACGMGTVNVYGGYGKGVKGGFIAMTSGGTINVAGGEWIANTDGTVGNNSNLYVLTAQSNKYESGFVGASIINVTGGTLRGGMDAWVLNNIEGEKAELNITGGNFNANPTRFVEEGYVAVENNGVWNVVKAVAKIGTTGYDTLAEAVAAVQEGETITILAGTHSEGTIKLPATLKNVTIKGESVARSTEGAVLKDMTISAADGNSYSYIGLTFDGITFDNSRILLTGWRNGEETIENLTVTNCTFKNLDDTSNTAPVHINKDAAEAVNGFTFTNNVIDGATGGSKSGIYAQVTGNVVVKDNVINNVSFRPYVIQVTTDDGIADNFTVTDNTFSGSAAGRAQGLGSNAEGTDNVNLVVSNNIFKGITDSQQICYWNFNAAKTTADLSKNYYDIDIVANPSKIYFNSAAADNFALRDMKVFPIYTELNENGTINTESAFTPKFYIAKVGENSYETLSEAFAAVTDDAQTVVVLRDVTENLTGAYLRGNITTENDAKVTITLTNSDWVYCPYTFVLDKNITLNVPALFYYAGGSVINGTVVAGAYYQRYAGTKLTINEPGSMTVTSETCIIRYMDGDPNAGIYVVGDNNDETVGLKLAVAYFYQGMINAKDANIVAGTYWQTNETDGQGSANLVLDNSTLTVTVYDHPAKATGNSTVTLTNGSVIDAKNGGFTYGDNTTLSVDATSKIIGKGDVPVQLPVAKINGKNYTSLQAAVDAVQNGETIKLIADVAENVTLTEKTGLYYTIDGAGKTMKGSINVASLSDTEDNRRITIKNINFVDAADANVDFISSVNTNHYPRLTVEGCTFTGSGNDGDVAIRLKSSHSVVIKDCTGTGLHSFIQNTSGWNLTIEGVTVTNSKSGFALGTVQGVTVKGANIDVAGYGIRMDAQYNNNAVIESNTVKAFIPVVVRKAEVNSDVTVKGTNTMTATNTDGLWMAVGTSEYETNGSMPTAATGRVKVALNDTGLSAEGVYGNFVPVAMIGETEYDDLQAAIKAAKAGETVTILAGTYPVPAMKAGIIVEGAVNADGTPAVLLEGTLSGTLENLTLKNLHIKGGNAQRWAYAKGDLVFENVTFEATSVYAIHFDGIAAGTNLTYKNCTIIGWAAMGGTPESCVFDGCTVKGNGSYGVIRTYFDATITNCTFDVANVNTTDAYQDGIHAVEGAEVVVTNCTNANGDMKDLVNVHATSIVVLDGVEIKNAAQVGGKDYATFEEALAAVQAGETLTLLADLNLSEILVINKAITLDGNGKKLTSTAGRAINVSDADGVTIKNLTINASGERAINVIQNATNVTIDKVTATAANYTVNVAASAPNAVVAISNSTLNGLCTVNVAAAGAQVTVDNSTVNCNDNNTTAGESYAALSLNKDAVGGSIVATNSTINVTAGSDSMKGRNGAENGTVTIDDSTEGVAVMVAAITYAGSDYYHAFATLAAAVEFAKAGETITLIRDVTLAGGYADATEGLRIEKEITLNGNGHTINCGNFQKGIRVYNPSNVSDFNVNFNNVKVVNNVANGRCIDTRSGNINLKVNSSTLIATNGNSQPLTIGGNDPVHRVTLNETTIDAGTSGYAVISFVSTNVDIQGVNNSTISGFAAFYLKGDAKTTNLNLGQGVYTGTNNHAVESGVFGTVVLEGDNNVVNLMGTNATVKAIANNTAPQAAFLVRGANNTIKVTKESAQIITEGNAYEAMVKADNAATTKFVDMGIERKLVAENRGYQFYSFEEAVRFAGNEGTIKVVNDFELAEAWTVAAGQNITLDLNGKTVSYTSAVAGEDMITNRGNLTITDSSDAKTGKLTYVNTDTTASNVTVSTISSEPGSVLNITGGTVENKTVKADGSSIYSFAIDMLTNGNLGDVTATIAGGTVYSDYMAIRQFNNGTACKNTLNITGGHIYGAKRAVQVHMDNNAAVTAINGGKIEAGEGGYALCNFAETSDLAVTGGEFIGAVYSARENFISGGIYDAEVYAGYCAGGYMPNKNVDGTYGVVLVADAYASIDGVTYGSLAAAINAAKAGETITLLQDVKENVTISKAVTLDGAGKTITGMINTKIKGYVTIKNIHFDGDSKKQYYAVRADNMYSLTIEDCTAANYAYGFLYANQNNYNVTVKNVTVENCGNYGAYASSVSGSATFENFKVSGARIGILVDNSSARKVNLKNVTFEGVETPLATNDKGTSIVTFAFDGINDMGKADYYTSQYVKVVAAAQVGTKVCGSLNDAFSAAQTGDTVKMLGDLSLTAEDAVKTTDVKERDVLFVVNGKEIILDMNGKKISVNHQSTTDAERLWAVIYVEDGAGLTVTGNGSIDVDANDNTPKVVYTFLKNGSTGYLVIENGNFHMDNTEDSMVFSANSNTVTVKGGTFILDAVASKPNGWPVFFGVNGTNTGYVNVQGGTYNYDIRHANEIKFGEGLTTTNNGDGTWTVVPGVAAVGEELYGTLQEAIEAAETGETVKLLADVTYTDADVIQNSDGRSVFNTVVGKEITLDMNGKTINVDYDATTIVYAVIDVANGASLNVTGNGKIDIPENGISFAYIFLKRGAEGALVIENGQFHMDNSADCMAFSTDSNTITVKGGTFILDAVASKPNGWPVLFGVNGNNTGYVNVVGGTFNYDINHQERPFEVFVPENLAVKNNGNGTWTIVPAQAYVTELLGNYVNEPGSREHKVGYATIAEAFAAVKNGETVTIVAGDYNGNLNVNKAITVKGETDEEANNLVTFNGRLNISADGATVKNLNFTNASGKAAQIGAKNVTIDGCSLVGSNGLYQSYTSGTVTFKNSYIKGGTYGIHFDGNAGGNIVIDNCTVIGWTSFASAIESVTISGTTFDEGNYNQLRLYQNATITDCTFNEKMNIDWGSSNKTAEFTDCSVEGDKDLTEIISLANIATKGLEVTIDGELVCVAAKIDSKYYLSLQAAIDAATEGQTVTIVSDLALTEGVTVAADKNIFIALNGKTITGTPAEAKAYAVITNKGTLTIQGEGAVVTDHQLAGSTGYAVNTITNCGTLTIDGATIENKSTAQFQIGYAIDNNSTTGDAVVTVVSGKVIASGSNYYDGIRQFCNSTTVANDVIVRGGEVSTIWMQNPSDGANKNTKDVKGSVTIEGGNVGVLSLEPSANFEAAMTGGHVGEISYFQTATGRDLVQFVTGGTLGTRISEEFLAYGYQLKTGEAAPYTVEWTGFRKEVTFIDGQFTEYVNENDIEVGTLTYQRTFPTVWTPIYVPFEIPVAKLAEQGFEVAYINGVRRDDVDEDGELDKFVMEVIYIHGGNADGSAKTLKANYPYFLRAKSAVTQLNLTLNGVTLHESEDKSYDCTTMTEKFEIVGNNSVMASSEFADNMYVVGQDANGKTGWGPINNGSSLKPFRVYMTVTDRENAMPIDVIEFMSISIRGEELADGTTVIYDVEMDGEQSVDYIYDLQGRRVLEPQKGNLYIINGKKVIF